jgi:PKD repeat protein
MAYCCTTPLPSGPGNIEAEPLLASFSHLSSQSPCIGAGSATYVTGVDIDGDPWLNPPCIGADQFISGQTTGPLSVTIVAGYTNVAPGLAVPFQALIDGSLAASAWDFKDGVVVSNQPYASHAWTAPGQYLVSLTAYNDSYPGCVSATVQVQVTATEVFYVNAANTTPLPPYTNWAGAATNIQYAIDAGKQPGRVVLVADGVYATGASSVDGVVTNRVVVPQGVEVRSVNGPAVTFITGGGFRCAYVAANSVLNGFTLTNGYSSQDGGGAWCEKLAVVTNCTLSGNSAASSGGGVNGGTLNNCTLSANSASGGGAAHDTTLNHCVLNSNSAESYGGGVYGGILNNCALNANSAKGLGGGAYEGTLNNCVLTGNSAANSGGGAYEGTLNNCTLTFNSAGEGGGAYGGTLNNCIAFYNTAANGPNYYNSTLSYSCSTPLPSGPGNLGDEPLLASATHLSADSPCIGRGSAAYASGVDIDGEPWLNPPCIGADQFVPGQTLGPLTVSIAATYTNVGTDFTVPFQAVINGRLSTSVWDFGDGVVVSNRPLATHAWTAPGQYMVSLTGYSDSYPNGVSATLVVQVGQAQVYYVNAANTTPAPPYTSLATAATNIQDAIDAGTQPGRLILVSDGVYASGGRAVSGVTNRVVLSQGLELRSVNGAAATVISGGGIRCAYVGLDAVLNGFTLTNGYAGDGGGAWCEVSGVVTNCTFSGNGASNSGGGAYGGLLTDCTFTNNSAGGAGGGAAGGTLIRCTLTGNSANTGGGTSGATLSQCVLKGNSAMYGGGAMWSVLNNCTLMGNGFGVVGGGAFGCTLNNCIVHSNVDQFGVNYSNCKLSYCCASPLPTDGVGNIDKDPLVVDFPGGNLRLQPNSPCINAGNNAFVSDATDLDGNPRTVGGTVDIGAYEFQDSGSMISYAWLQQYGLPTDGSADLDDPDGDGMNNWQEWVCGTNPTNSLSVLRMLSAGAAGGNVTVRWQSVAGINYFLVRTPDIDSLVALAPTNSITNIVLVATDIVGQTNATSYTDTNATGGGTFFYRVGVTGP